MTATRKTVVYFVLTYTLSWLGALALVAPKLMAGVPLGKFDGLMMFPVMLIGPCLSGIVLTAVFDGRAGLRDLGARLVRLRVSPAWYLVLLLPFVLVAAVLQGFSLLVSPDFAPNDFFIGAAFGVVAGLLEEIGWTGFALPRMLRDGNALRPAILLGVLWGLWHLPVIDFLGAAWPHGAWWPLFALAFVAAMTAIRVVIAWVYVNTRSVALAQLVHACSTGALVVLSPQVGPGQEALWYVAYAGVLWLAVAAVMAVYGKGLRRAG